MAIPQQIQSYVRLSKSAHQNRWAGSKGKNAGNFVNSIHLSKLEFCNGNVDRSRGLLKQLHLTVLSNQDRFEDYVVACLFCCAFDLMAHIIGSYFPDLADAAFGLSAPDESIGVEQPGIIRWALRPSRGCSFEFTPRFWDVNVELAPRRFVQILGILARYNASRLRDSGSIYINTSDNDWVDGLAFCARSNGSFLIPDPDFLSSGGYADYRKRIAEKRVPFAKRRPVAFWRGGTQGESTSGWRGLQRIRLCALAAEQPDPTVFDVGVSHIVGSHVIGEAEIKEITESGFMRPFVPADELARVKYNIDIDGHSNAWSALFMKLLSGSPVLKVASPTGCVQWYYEKLKPWINYVPVAPDLSDLVEKINWLRQRDDVAARIGLSGRELALAIANSPYVETSWYTIERAFIEASTQQRSASDMRSPGADALPATRR
jgi:hypothetical protein